MYSVFSSYNQITRLLLVSIVTLVMIFYPLVPVLLAQEATTTPEESTTTTQETTQPEPTQTEGTDGTDASDGNDGGDGTSADDPPANNEPQEGDEGESTQDGTTATTGEEEASDEPTEDTTIDTGDADASGTINNQVNLSELKALYEAQGLEFPIVVHYIYWDHESGSYKVSDPSVQYKLDKALEDGILDPQEYLDIITPEEDTTASTTNNAIVENEADIEAETGSNQANGNENVTINTGDARAVANILNVVNTNIFDSEGFFLFLDNLSEAGVQGNLDFRDFEFFNPEAVQNTSNQRESANGATNPINALCPTCGGAGDLTINTGQNAQITNDIVVRSGTGANAALNNAGDVDITTGDAYAAANAINLANTNIVDSNYLLLTFNNFGDYNNDIIFPSANEFLELFATGGQTTPSDVNINSNNTTTVNNNTDVTGGTGDNTISGANGSSIGTGDASAQTNTLNQLNSNLFGGSSFSILVKVHGEWSGDVLGAPDGLEWRETENGIEIYYDAEGTGTASGFDSYNVISENSATIDNNIQVTALTGENKIAGVGGEASIATGDAFAAANTINVANTNVIGKNWLMAVVNIFGDWNGNLSFGVPNLWVGAKAEFEGSRAKPGATVTYQYTVMNTGDAPANNVCVRNRFDHRYLDMQITQPATDRQVRQGEVEYCVGTVEAGEVREFSRRGTVSNDIPFGTTFVSNDIEVLGAAGEEQLDDNKDKITFDAWKQPPQDNFSSSDTTKIQYKPSPKLTVTKRNSAPFGIRASSTVNYTIVIKNEGAGSAYDTKLVDTLQDEEGNKLYTETWNLKEIYPGEEIEVSYTTFFNGATEPGLYTNYAHVEGLGGYHTFKYGHSVKSPTVGSSLQVFGLPRSTEAKAVIEIVEESEVTQLQEGTSTNEILPPPEEGSVLDKVLALVPVLKQKNLGPLYGPQFVQHPVYSQREALPEPFLHPYFTQHPVFIEPSAVLVEEKTNDADGRTAATATEKELVPQDVAHTHPVPPFQAIEEGQDVAHVHPVPPLQAVEDLPEPALSLAEEGYTTASR